MWYDVHTKFYEDLYRRSSNIKVYVRNFRGCNVGVSDEFGAMIYILSLINTG
jgi:hypothetical protein